MPKFYVDVLIGDQTIEDEAGLEAGSLLAAQRLMVLNLTELVRATCRTGECTVTASLSDHDHVELLRATLSLHVQQTGPESIKG